MGFEEYVEYIINKFKVELSNRWVVEIVPYYSASNKYGQEIFRHYDGIYYLSISNRYWNYNLNIGTIREMYDSTIISAETAYQSLKRDLQYTYLKDTLWKQ